eukprot:scaffold26237_cov162-Skeletonema_dohrnii-CCMP3373.AAC.3
MNDNKSSSPTKKRKANDGRATTDGSHDVNTGNTNDGGGYFSGQREGASASGPPSPTENNTSQLDRMEQIMMRMEEKLATVSSLESRCEQLEKKCSSLENILELASQSTKEHMNRLHYRRNDIGNNTHDQGHINRGWKLYRLLSIRNQSMSNVKHFGNIDVKMLPNMLEAMQRYHNAASVYNVHSFGCTLYVEPVSLVYETLRKWDKVMEL